MASSRVRQVFEQGTDAFNAHDSGAMAQTMAEDVTVRAPGDLELRGRSAAAQFYQTWIDAFPDARVTLEAAHVLDDAVIEEGVFTGTHRGTLRLPTGDVPATGRSVRVEYVQVLRFRGDKVASFHLLFDRVAMLEQLGIFPQPSPAAYARPGAPAAQPSVPH